MNMTGTNYVHRVGELEAAGSALIEVMNVGTTSATGAPYTSGCSSPAVEGVAVWCGSFARPARSHGALAVMP
jgi:hypothetical protein